MECLVKENDCFKVWKMHYKKNILESEILLSYFGNCQLIILTIESFSKIFLFFVAVATFSKKLDKSTRFD